MLYISRIRRLTRDISPKPGISDSAKTLLPRRGRPSGLASRSSKKRKDHKNPRLYPAVSYPGAGRARPDAAANGRLRGTDPALT